MSSIYRRPGVASSATGISATSTNPYFPSSFGGQSSSFQWRWDEVSTTFIGSNTMATEYDATYNATTSVTFSAVTASVVNPPTGNSTGTRLSLAWTATTPLTTNNTFALTLPGIPDVARRGTVYYRIVGYNNVSSNAGFGFGFADSTYEHCVGWIHYSSANNLLITNYNADSTTAGTSWPWRQTAPTVTFPRPGTQLISSGYTAGTLYRFDYDFSWDTTGSAPALGYIGGSVDHSSGGTSTNAAFPIGGIATSPQGTPIHAGFDGVQMRRPVFLFNIAGAGTPTNTVEIAELMICKHPLDS